MKRSRVPGRIDRTGIGQQPRRGISDWVSVNPVDGSWLTDDPNSVVATVSASAAGVRFQNNKEAFALHMDNNDDSAAAYYRRLLATDGTAMTFSDPGWSIEFLIKRQTNGDDSGSVNLAICDDPTDRSNRNWLGLTMVNQANGNGKWYVGTASGMNSGTNASTDRVLAQIFNAVDTSSNDDDDEITHTIAYANLNSNLAAIQQGAKTSITQEYDQSDNVFIMVSSAFGTESNSEPANDTDNTWKVWYRLHYSPQGVDPEYLLNGRTALHL